MGVWPAKFAEQPLLLNPGEMERGCFPEGTASMVVFCSQTCVNLGDLLKHVAGSLWKQDCHTKTMEKHLQFEMSKVESWLQNNWGISKRKLTWNV